VIGAIVELGGLLFKGATDYIKGKQKIALAEAENRARLLRDRERYNADWEMAQLADKDKWLRRLSFGLFSFPIVMAYVDPNAIKQYFDVALSAMPEWYIKVYLAMVGGIWGMMEALIKKALDLASEYGGFIDLTDGRLSFISEPLPDEVLGEVEDLVHEAMSYCDPVLLS